MPTFRAITKPSLPPSEASHQPSLHLPTSTVVPAGISVRTSLSVPAALRRLVSVRTAIGFAVAQAADSRVKMAAAAAIRTKLMALLVFPSRSAARAGFNVRHRPEYKAPLLQKNFLELDFLFPLMTGRAAVITPT